MLTTGRSLLKASYFRTLGALVRRDFSITRSYRLAFLLDVFFGIMNLLVFYYISRTLTPRVDSLQGAPSYFAFASVGIVLSVVMQAATSGITRRIREEQLTGTLEILAMQPISGVQLAVGLTGFPFLFGLARAALYIAFAGLLLELPLGDADVLGFVVMLATTGLALSALGIALGGVVLVVKQGEVFAAVLTFGLTLLSGALFPRDLLPGWLQPFGDLLPTRWALDGLRSALFQGGDWQGAFAALAIESLVLVPLALWMFSALLGVVKRSGSLSQY
jgi:ABC-2 type transport system permease protein